MEQPADINAHLAGRLRSLRSEQGLTLDGLADRTGVSRSMISLIERGESSPTAVVLDKLAAGLGVTLASLFAEKASVSASLCRAAPINACGVTRAAATCAATFRPPAFRLPSNSSRWFSRPGRWWPTTRRSAPWASASRSG
ncbi:helix-turn-helix domain-containing protein [Microvirga aerilata]|uniref:helix-turn-helix domain-containing protein n=1 Tax=Microvirga aerilata TaxID=670292 RepID=UPI0036374378